MCSNVFSTFSLKHQYINHSYLKLPSNSIICVTSHSVYDTVLSLLFLVFSMPCNFFLLLLEAGHFVLGMETELKRLLV